MAKDRQADGMRLARTNDTLRFFIPNTSKCPFLFVEQFLFPSFELVRAAKLPEAKVEFPYLHDQLYLLRFPIAC